MKKALEYRIYPTKDQEAKIGAAFGCARYVYNYYLSLNNEKFKNKEKSLTRFQCDKDLTNLKTQEPWLQEVDKFALQQALLHLNNAYVNYFRKRALGFKHKQAGFPKFKKKIASRQSYSTCITRTNIAVNDNCIKLPKLSFIKARIHRPPEGAIKSATIKKTPTGKYFVSILCEKEYDPLPKTGAIVGIDLGIKDFITTSDDIRFENRRYFKKYENRKMR